MRIFGGAASLILTVFLFQRNINHALYKTRTIRSFLSRTISNSTGFHSSAYGYVNGIDDMGFFFKYRYLFSMTQSMHKLLQMDTRCSTKNFSHIITYSVLWKTEMVERLAF